ncbi:MAG: DUF2520 domain-containing protein [Acidobacteria bacterium]|nr:DUF2520 domain-containing protein [Acidobacteriota bacterium]
MKASTFAIIGPGRLGSSVFHALHDAGWTCTAVRSRTPEGLARARALLPAGWIGDTWDDPVPWPETDIILLTVPDREIPLAGLLLGNADAPGAAVVLHASGLHPSADLAPCRGRGMAIGSWHPLQTFPRPDTPAAAFRGTFCAIEGDPPAVTAAMALARTLGMHPWLISPASKPLYHAAASIAANLTHILIIAAKNVMIQAGIDPENVGPALAPLVHSSVEAALGARGFEAMTGPLARGDTATVRAHLGSLPAPLAEAYSAIARLGPPG